MENNKEKKLYFSNIDIELDSVNYSKVMNNPKEKVNRLAIVTRDNSDVISINNNCFVAKFIRKVELEPKVFFEISVYYDLTFYFDKRTVKEYENNFEALRELVNEKLLRAIELTGVTSKASAVISSLTMNNGNPVITPPTFQK